MADLTALTPKDCPLLESAGDLIEQFNRVTEQFRKLLAKYPDLGSRDDVKKLTASREHICERMKRPRYLVGFLGTSQAGKSTTFNHVLGVSGDEAPAMSGRGNATTCTITRLYQDKSGPHRLQLRYFTPEQYELRRNKLCKAFGIPSPAGQSESDLLKLLESFLRPSTAGPSAGRPLPPADGEQEVLPDDGPYLRDFLRSYQTHKDRYVTAPAFVEGPPYARRADFLNHASGASATPSANLMLQEAVIPFNNPHLSPRLEMIDCPGLGSPRSVDTILTKDFLSELDGALMFLRADHVENRDAAEILKSLKRNFGRLANRVWVVVNKVDSLNKVGLYGDSSNKETTFDVIAQFLQKCEIPHEQLCFTSSKVHEVIDPATGEAAVQRAADRLSVAPDDPIPPRCKERPAFKIAFEALLKDGGIARLRQLIREDLARAVAEEIQKDCRLRIDDLQRCLTEVEEDEDRRRDLSDQDRADARVCFSTVYEVLWELNGQMEFCRPQAEHLRRELLKTFESGPFKITIVEAERDPHELQKMFRMHTQDLEKQLHHVLDEPVVSELYEKVYQKLANLPAVPLLGDKQGPGHLWQTYRQEDRKDRGWRAELLPSFLKDDPFAGRNHDADGSFDGQRYVGLIREKIRLTTHQTMHALCVRLRQRLQSMKTALGRLVYEEKQP